MGKVGEVVVNLIDTDTLVGYILDFIRCNCQIPMGYDLLFGDLCDGNGISLFPKSNAEVLEYYVTGGYLAQFSFYICVKSKPTTDKERIDLYNFYGELSTCFSTLSDKLTDYNSSFEVNLKNNLTLNDIKSVSSPAIVQHNDDGSIVLQALYNIIYERS